MVSDEAIAREALGLSPQWKLPWAAAGPNSGKRAVLRNLSYESVLDATVPKMDWFSARDRLIERRPKPIAINWVAGFDADHLPCDEPRTVLTETSGFMPVRPLQPDAPALAPALDKTRFPHQCKCGAPAYVGFTSTECSAGCEAQGDTLTCLSLP